MTGEDAGARNVERTVREELGRRVGRELPEPLIELELESDLGLASMDVVELADALEDALGVDVLKQTPVTDLRTVGDLLTAARRVTGAGDRQQAEDSDLLLASRRAAARRRRRTS